MRRWVFSGRGEAAILCNGTGENRRVGSVIAATVRASSRRRDSFGIRDVCFFVANYQCIVAPS